MIQVHSCHLLYSSISMSDGLFLLFQLCLTQKVTTESLTGNGQVKKGSQLESMLPSMASLLQKKIWIKEPTSQ